MQNIVLKILLQVFFLVVESYFNFLDQFFLCGLNLKTIHPAVIEHKRQEELPASQSDLCKAPKSNISFFL